MRTVISRQLRNEKLHIAQPKLSLVWCNLTCLLLDPVRRKLIQIIYKTHSGARYVGENVAIDLYMVSEHSLISYI